MIQRKIETKIVRNGKFFQTLKNYDIGESNLILSEKDRSTHKKLFKEKSS